MTDKISVTLPKVYESVPVDEGVADSVSAYRLETVQCHGAVRVYPIDADRAMYVDDPFSVIDGLRQALAPNQGIVEVRIAKLASGARGVYSIVKTRTPHDALQYVLTFHIVSGEDALCVQGAFEEAGKTGARDAVGYAMLVQAGRIDETGQGFARDPYDPTYMRGELMTLAEDESLDNMFPEHPLTIARALATHIVNNA